MKDQEEFIKEYTSSPAAKAYEAAADKVVQRIAALVPSHPEILTIDDPWKLLKVPGFNVDDIGPSLFQVSWALRHVQASAKKEQP